MHKIAVVGTSGSGKTTLGKKLAAKLRITTVDLDELNWEPGWKEVSHQEFDARVQRALDAPGWVISGNYSRVQNYYLEHADTLVWLDYSFATVLRRVLKRTFCRVAFRQPCCNGNRETLRQTFSRDSIVLWVFQTYWKRKQKNARLFEPDVFPHLHKIRFRNPREAQRWFEALEALEA